MRSCEPAVHGWRHVHALRGRPADPAGLLLPPTCTLQLHPGALGAGRPSSGAGVAAVHRGCPVGHRPPRQQQPCLVCCPRCLLLSCRLHGGVDGQQSTGRAARSCPATRRPNYFYNMHADFVNMSSFSYNDSYTRSLGAHPVPRQLTVVHENGWVGRRPVLGVPLEQRGGLVQGRDGAAVHPRRDATVTHAHNTHTACRAWYRWRPLQ